MQLTLYAKLAVDDLHDCRDDVHLAERALAADYVAAAVVEAEIYRKKTFVTFLVSLEFLIRFHLLNNISVLINMLHGRWLLVMLLWNILVLLWWWLMLALLLIMLLSRLLILRRLLLKIKR